jgi:hypothetical protein
MNASGEDPRVPKSSSFLLLKWYLDCIADNGDGVIVYVADLRWKAWHMRYASTLRFSGKKVETTTSIRKCSLPESANGQIVVKLPHVAIEGVWSGFAAPIERAIFETSAGSVHWNCLQPASRVKLVLDRSREMIGFGYAECLEISVPPWKFPLNELHWGRFVTESDSLVWIDWRGPYSRRIVVHNGGELEPAVVTDSAVSSLNSHVRLALDRGLVLRSGILGDTVFSGIAALARILPASMLRVRESKWRSWGNLISAERTVSGWAIHEVVRWKEE